MFEYYRIDILEGIDTDKIGSLPECIIFHYGYLVWMRFPPKICDDCHDFTQKSMSFKNVAVARIKKLI